MTLRDDGAVRRAAPSATGTRSSASRRAPTDGRDYAVEPDASTASYFFAAAAVSGGRVKVPGLRRDGGLQGDVRFLDVLEAMGCAVADEPDGVVVAGPGDARAGLTVDMSDISDTFMTLAAARPVRRFAGDHHRHRQRAPQGIGPHRRHGGQPARASACAPSPAPTSCACTPARPTGGRIDPHGDHRIAMSFAVLGLRTPGVVIDDPGCVSKTCPAFFELWAGSGTGNSLKWANRG